MRRRTELTLFTLDKVLSKETCQALIKEAEGYGFQDAPISTGSGFQMRPDIRNNTRVMLDDIEQAQKLWTLVKDRVPEYVDGWRAIGLNERFRFYRYDPGQRFKWHMDGYFARHQLEKSKLTMMIYLNEDFTGGDTQFANGEIIRPKTGSVLLFEHPILHQGDAVIKGRKYVLRTDVMYRGG